MFATTSSSQAPSQVMYGLVVASLPSLAVAAAAAGDSLDDTQMLILVAVSALVGAVVAFFMFGSSTKAKKPSLPKTLPVDDFVPFPLIRKEVLSHDSATFVLGLPEGHILGLPVGQHLSLKFTDPATGKAVQRSYTPLTDDTTVGEVHLVIKVYKPLAPKFPNGGAMSQHVDSLNIGDTILVKGPKGHIQYHGRGQLTVKPLGKPKQERRCQHFGLLAGGTGISPVWQIIQAVLVNPEYCDKSTTLSLLYANQTPADILLRPQLEALQAQFPDRFQIWYTVDRDAGDDWKYSTGFINKDMIQQHLVAKGRKTQFLMCGPPPMLKYACIPALTELGFTDQDYASF